MRTWMILGGCLIILALAAAPQAAEPGGREPPSFLLDNIVVTAKRSAEPLRTGDVNPETNSVMATTIHREAFDGKMDSIAEILEKEAGVQVRQSGGLGSFASVSLRGASGDQVLIFMDGILLNDASGGGVDLGAISLADVAAIDIYRGITPIHFGNASIGGAVNIRTLRSDKGLKASASAGYGSFATRQLNGFINHKPGRLDYLISAEHLASDNDFPFLNDNGTTWNHDDDRKEKRNNARTEQANILAKVGYDASDTLRVDLMNQTYDKTRGIPSWNNSPLTRSRLETFRTITTCQLTADDLTAARLNTRTKLSYAFKEELYDDRGGHIGLGQQHSTYTTERWTAEQFVEWMGAWQHLIGNVGLFGEGYASQDHLNKSNPRDSRRQMFWLGLQDSLFLLDDTLIVSPAVRYTGLEDTLRSGTSIWGTALATRDRSDRDLSAQIGLVYRPRQWIKIKSNLAEYVRQPSFFELFGDRGLFTGNPDLKAESGVNVDIGAECGWTGSAGGFQRLTFGAAWFSTDARDLITRVYDARGIGKSTNISGASIQGVEISAAVEFLDHFRALANITHQDPVNESRIEAFDGQRLPGRFENAFRGRLEARHAGVTLYGEYLRETGMYYDTANLLPAADKEELNAGVAWLSSHWLFQVEGRNLADASFEDFNGYPLPGRSFYASVKYSF